MKRQLTRCFSAVAELLIEPVTDGRADGRTAGTYIIASHIFDGGQGNLGAKDIFLEAAAPEPQWLGV